MFKSTISKFVAFLVATGLITAVSIYLLLPTLKAQETTPFAIGIAIASSLTQLGAIWYFMTSLKTFKQNLRAAYYLLSIGILLFCLLQLQLVIDVFVSLSGNALVRNLLIVAPYALSSLFIYLGMRKFARLLAVRNLWAKLYIALGFSILVAATFIALPHPDLSASGISESTIKAVMGIVSWCCAFSFAAMMVALRIRNSIGEVYKTAMTWVSVALGVLSFTAFHEIINKIYLSETAYAIHMSEWPFVLVGVAFLIAGLKFKEVGLATVHLPANASYIDVVIGLAQMASNPRMIDTELNKVRYITSKRGQKTESPKQGLSQAEKDTLLSVYSSLENYLTTKEPLRRLSREGLRNGLPEDFLQTLVKLESTKSGAALS